MSNGHFMMLSALPSGTSCYVSGRGDLGINPELRALYNWETPVEGITFVRITKGGNAIVQFKGKEYSIPPRNVYINIEDAP